MPEPTSPPKPAVDLEEALQRLERVIGTFENEPDVAMRERVSELLEQIDVVHRQLVWKVGERIHAADAALFEGLLADPITSVLFEMYGLVAPAAASPDDAPTAMVGLDALLASIPAPYSWFPVALDADLPEATLLARDVGGERVLVVRHRGELRAYVDQCPGSPLTLNAGLVHDGVLLCPWHDCRYDLATGRRIDREAPGLGALQCAVTDGEIRIGLRSRRKPAA